MGLRSVLEREDTLFGVSDQNGAIPVGNLVSQWSIEPGRTFSEFQNFNAKNVWSVQAGASVHAENNLNHLQTDGTEPNSRAVLETGPLGIYRSGTEARAAGGFTVASELTGDQFFEFGYGREGGDSYVRYRKTADDLQIRVSNEITIEKTVSRSEGHLDNGNVTALGQDSNEVDIGSSDECLRVYGIDPMDGEGPSGIEYNRRRGYVAGFRIGWYGPTVTVPFLVAVGNIANQYRERVFPLCVLEPVGEPLITRPNEPYTFIADNNGTAPGSGGGLHIDTGGRQFSYGGDRDAPLNPITHQAPPTELPMDGTGTEVTLKESGSGITREWFVIGVFKRVANKEGTAVILDGFRATANNDLYVHPRHIPESDLSGTLEYSEPTDTHSEENYVLVDAWGDTPDRVTIDSSTIDGHTKLLGESWGGSIVSGGGTQNNFQFGEGSLIDLQLIRENPIVLLGSTIDGSTGTLNPNIEFTGVT